MKKRIRLFIAAACGAAAALGCFACGTSAPSDSGDEDPPTPPPITTQVDLDKATQSLTLSVTETAASFELPYECDGATVRWSSNNGAIEPMIAMDGTITANVNRLAGADTNVTLTATLYADGNSKTKDFSVNVLGYEAALGVGKYSVASKNMDIVADGDDKYAESLSGGYRYVWFDDESDGDFYCETKATAFASYNVNTENYFGIVLASRYGKVFFYVDAGNSLMNSRCGYAVYDGSVWDYSARKKNVDIVYRGGRSVDLAVARSGNNVVFIVDDEPIFYSSAEELGAADEKLDVGFMTKDVHAAFFGYDYISVGGDGVIDDVDLDSIQVWTDAMQAEKTKGYCLSFASVADGGSDNADNIHVKFERGENGITFDMVGFGAFEKTEIVNAVIHTSSQTGVGWGLQQSDIMLKFTADSVYIRSNLSDYWTWTAPETGDPIKLACEFKSYAYYFTLKATVPYESLNGVDRDTAFKIMFTEGYLVGNTLNLYNSTIVNNMRLYGVGTGDPAFQTSYVTVAADGKISR